MDPLTNGTAMNIGYFKVGADILGFLVEFDFEANTVVFQSQWRSLTLELGDTVDYNAKPLLTIGWCITPTESTLIVYTDDPAAPPGMARVASVSEPFPTDVAVDASDAVYVDGFNVWVHEVRLHSPVVSVAEWSAETAAVDANWRQASVAA